MSGGRAIDHHSQSVSLSSSARLWDTFRDFGTLSRFDFGTLFGPSVNRDQRAKHNVNELLQFFSGQKVSRFLDNIYSRVLLCTLKGCNSI